MLHHNSSSGHSINTALRHVTSTATAAAAAATGPVWFLNPTTRYYSSSPRPPGPGTGTELGQQRPSEPGVVGGAAAGGREGEGEGKCEGEGEGIWHVWRSRDNRKGRHGVVVRRSSIASARGVGVPLPRRPTNSPPEVARGLMKMLVRFPVWDVSYDVAVIFTLGSIIWVINGFFVWLPLAAPWTEFAGEVMDGGGITAFVGATIFEVGSVLLMLEAVNENRTACFGWALEEALFHGDEECRHHHVDRERLLPKKRRPHDGSDTAADVEPKLPPGAAGNNGVPTKPERGRAAAAAAWGEVVRAAAGEERKWSWCPTWTELRSHYLREIGFLACASQMAGATIFWISGFTSLAPIQEAMSLNLSRGVYWLPQVVGGTGFIVSSLLFMLETQKKWYLPAPSILGWHIGFWNLVGAIGFTLCGALGFAITQSDAIEYAATLATFVGSWAFLIGSVIQWYESLDKYTVSVEDIE